jgi:small subunit ribosomal protein S20
LIFLEVYDKLLLLCRSYYLLFLASDSIGFTPGCQKTSPKKIGSRPPEADGMVGKKKLVSFVFPKDYFMPNTKSAAKAMRQSLRRRARNTVTKDHFKSAVKEVKKLIAAGKKSDAALALSKAMSTLDKAVKKHVLKKNTASRKKSRLAKALAKLK